jgi:hypothetical protein
MGKEPVKNVEGMEDMTQSKFDPKAQADNPTDDRVSCQYCATKFNPDRIDKHHATCSENPTNIAKKKAAFVKKREYTSGDEKT